MLRVLEMQWPRSDFKLAPNGEGFIHIRCNTQFYHVQDLAWHNSEVCALSRKLSGLDKPKRENHPVVIYDRNQRVLVSDAERETLER